jgi:hypothetical protein
VQSERAAGLTQPQAPSSHTGDCCFPCKAALCALPLPTDATLSPSGKSTPKSTQSRAVVSSPGSANVEYASSKPPVSAIRTRSGQWLRLASNGRRARSDRGSSHTTGPVVIGHCCCSSAQTPLNAGSNPAGRVTGEPCPRGVSFPAKRKPGPLKAAFSPPVLGDLRRGCFDGSRVGGLACPAAKRYHATLLRGSSLHPPRARRKS